MIGVGSANCGSHDFHDGNGAYCVASYLTFGLAIQSLTTSKNSPFSSGRHSPAVHILCSSVSLCGWQLISVISSAHPSAYFTESSVHFFGSSANGGLTRR